MKSLIARNRSLFLLLTPVVLVGLLCSTLLVKFASKPLERYFMQEVDANLRLASKLGLRACEDNFLYMLDMRMEDSAEMNRVLRREALQEIKSLSGNFPGVHLLVLEEGRRVLESSFAGMVGPYAGRSLSGRDNEALFFDLNGQKAKAHVRYFPFWDWHVVSFAFEKDYNGPVRMAYLVTYASAGGVFLAMVATLLGGFHFFIKRPLGRLVSATDGVSEGRLQRIESISNNEFGRLMRSFNAMLDSLEKEQGEVKSLIHMLKQSEERFRALFEQANWAVFVYDQKGRFVDVNEQGCSHLGYSRGEILTMSMDEVAPGFDGRAGAKGLWSVEERGGASFEARLRRKNGSMYFANINLTTIHFGEQKFVVALVQDITQRKLAEEALRESEQRFRHLLEDVDMVAVQGYDENRRVIFWNKASERLYGYTRQEALGRRLVDLIIPEHMHEQILEETARWMHEGARIPSAELELKHKDGSAVHVYSSHVIQLSPQGKKEMFCVDVDLSEIKKAHAQLLKAKKLAESANRAKSEFLANMSHEIRTPLNGILGMLQLLETTSQDKEQREYTEAAMKSCDRLTRLLSDLLDLSRIEAGKVSMEDEMFAIKDVVDATMQLFTPVASQKGVDLRLKMDAATPRQVKGDPVRLQQILSNLVGNAVKFTESGYVEVLVSPLAGEDGSMRRMLFIVADTGPGISDDKLKRLFKPFTQVSQGFTRQYQGAGLGLAICKNLVEIMGGNMAVASEEGRGTSFHLSVPFHAAEVESAPHKKAAKRTAASASCDRRVLLAEDDPVNALATQRLLESAGCSVTLVEDGNQALEALKRESFDVVLMDIQMPVMDGLEATTAIRRGEAGPENTLVPIIAMTAYAMDGDKQTFLGAGMDGYVSKPLTLETLQQAMRDVLAGQVAG